MSARPGLPQGTHGVARKADEFNEFADRAACRNHDAALFFPEKGVKRTGEQARAICQRECPVRQECLAYALKYDERFGIWGGLSETARRKIRRLQRAAANAQSVNA